MRKLILNKFKNAICNFMLLTFGIWLIGAYFHNASVYRIFIMLAYENEIFHLYINEPSLLKWKIENMFYAILICSLEEYLYYISILL